MAQLPGMPPGEPGFQQRRQPGDAAHESYSFTAGLRWQDRSEICAEGNATENKHKITWGIRGTQVKAARNAGSEPKATLLDSRFPAPENSSTALPGSLSMRTSTAASVLLFLALM